MVVLISRALVLSWQCGTRGQHYGESSMSAGLVSEHGLCASPLGLRAALLWAEQGAADGGAS